MKSKIVVRCVVLSLLFISACSKKVIPAPDPIPPTTTGKTSTVSTTEKGKETTEKTLTTIGEDSTSVTDRKDPSSLQTEIVIGTRREEKDFIQKTVNDYLKKNHYSSVSVKMLEMGDLEATEIEDYSSSSAPDIYSFTSHQMQDLLKLGALDKMNEASIRQMKALLSKNNIEAAKVNSSYYGYPYSESASHYLYYNKDIIQEEHLTSFEKVLEDCKKVGTRIGYALDKDSSYYGLSALFTYGASYQMKLNEKGETESITSDFDTEKGLTALKMIQSIRKEENFITTSPGAREFLPLQSLGFGAVVEANYLYEDFCHGVMNEDGTTKYPGLKEKLGVARLPTFTYQGETKDLFSFSYYRMYGINPKKKSTKERQELLHSLTSHFFNKEVQKERFSLFKEIPTNKEAKKSEEVLADDYSRVSNEQCLYSVPETLIPNNLYDAADNLFSSLDNNLNANEEDLKSYLKDFKSSLESIN